MGGQGIERREILRYIGIASVAATFPGFHNWVFAGVADHGHTSQTVAATDYKPLFFSADQYRLVEHLTDIIIPHDDTPGAKQAGVAEFIDFMVANCVPVNARYDIRRTQDAVQQGKDAQVQFTLGLDWINSHSKAEFGKLFLDATPAQQNSLIEELAYKAKFKPTTEMGREVFQLIRDYTVIGYYTSKIGLESLGYPGLRVAWSELPGCKHHGDPEHAHLKPPTSVNAS